MRPSPKKVNNVDIIFFYLNGKTSLLQNIQTNKNLVILSFVAGVPHEKYEYNQQLNGDSNQSNMCHHLCKHRCAENDMVHPSSHYSETTNLIQEQESSVKSNVSTSITNVKTKCLDI